MNAQKRVRPKKPVQHKPALPHYEPKLPLFELGQIVSTSSVVRYMSKMGLNILPYVGRHVLGDWGIVSEFDKQANERAIEEDLRIFSVYEVGDRRIWIITEANRSRTTVLFPEDY